MSTAAAASVQVDLRTPDWAVSLSMSVPAEPAPIEAWLPVLHQLASRAAASAEAAVEQAGGRVSCQKGCGACCRQLVAIALPEARALARLVAEMPEPRRGEIQARFADAMRRVRESGVLERDYSDDGGAPDAPLARTAQQRLGAAWFRLGVACPFLEDESCSIHEQRPLTCREYLVTSPAAACAKLYREPVDRIEAQVHLGQSLARATATIAGVSVAMVPLAMSLELPPEVDAELARPHDRVGMLETILNEVGEARIERV